MKEKQDIICAFKLFSSHWKKQDKKLFFIKHELPMCLVNCSTMAGIKKTDTYQNVSLFLRGLLPEKHCTVTKKEKQG